MYNATVEPERQFDEKRQADDRKTKQKMDLIRSKLKISPRKVNDLRTTMRRNVLSLGYSPSILSIEISFSWKAFQR